LHGWKSYATYGCDHALCNAHHLRELQYILDQYQQPSALQMSLRLSSLHHQVKAAKADGKHTLSQDDLDRAEARYQAILDQGFAANPLPPPLQEPRKRRGRIRRSPPRNLLERLKTHQIPVLRFIHNFAVPFDNNQSERDLRMMKLKQKISGGFRSEDGARRFCRIRGYLATLHKSRTVISWMLF